ncbi:hypothetical protein R1flu_007630 [Riccia fluitans]|uniref:Uncharacterized protein n=1 Tax=Riccia fluitans TaxID=41844 RepID=A0ABD1YZF5_9MARC
MNGSGGAKTQRFVLNGQCRERPHWRGRQRTCEANVRSSYMSERHRKLRRSSQNVRARSDVEAGTRSVSLSNDKTIEVKPKAARRSNLGNAKMMITPIDKMPPREHEPPREIMKGQTRNAMSKMWIH